MHPVMAAKQGMTIDHLTGGRFSLNIVTGWYRPEIEMFGEPQMEHDERYERAIEWLDIIKQLWMREEEFDFEGRFYTIRKGWLAPEADPEALPGGDECGRLRQGPPLRGEVLRCRVHGARLAQARRHDARRSTRYRALAREEYGRELQVWTNAYIVQGETEQDARAFFDHYVHAQGDWEAVDNLVTMLGINAQSLPPGVEQQLKEHFIAGWGGFPLVGTKEQVVDGLALLSKAGFDGVSCRGRAMSRRCANSSARRCRCWCRPGCADGAALCKADVLAYGRAIRSS